MGIKITIPNTSSDTLTFGSANTTTAAQIAGIDSGSSNGQLALYTTASGTSTERVRVDASGNVGIGTASPGATLDLRGTYIQKQASDAQVLASLTQFTLQRNSNDSRLCFGYTTANSAWNFTASYGSTGAYAPIAFSTSDTERMRIGSDGNLLLGLTSNGAAGAKFTIYGATGQEVLLTGTSGTCIKFTNSQNVGGAISVASGGGTTYGTSSDYRLKHDIQPMTGALAKVAQLNPVTYKWNVDESESQGFIAHELQAVIPDAVVGEKDAVDSEGNPQYQNVDTSFLVATLTAAIQELNARLTALENK